MDRKLVTILPGETVRVEAVVRDGTLIDLKAVDTVADPGRTITLHLEQRTAPADPASEDDHEKTVLAIERANPGVLQTSGRYVGMVLTIDNPFPQELKFRLGMVKTGEDRLVATSVYPVKSQSKSLELWPHPFTRLAAVDFRLVDAETAQAEAGDAKPVQGSAPRSKPGRVAVIFGFTVNDRKELVECHVLRVIDPATQSMDAIPYEVSAAYRDEACTIIRGKGFEPSYKDGKLVEAYTHFALDLAAPDRVVTQVRR
jgi:hypothetical protein